jgi:DUF1680 family protein
MLLQYGPEYFPVPRGTASDPATWHRPPTPARVPTGGVTMSPGGLFHTALSENRDYLLRSFGVDHLLHPFRRRAGHAEAPGADTQVPFWDTRLEGSNAGRFLMGAGNTLRWLPDAELRRRLDEVVAGIAACQEPDGYLHGFPHQHMIAGDPGTRWGEAQRSAYARSWLTQGLLEAALVGNAQALPLIRAGHDWFNRCPYLPQLQQAQLWAQGHVASTRMHLSPVGTSEDLQVAERHYLVDPWLRALAARDPAAIWLDGLGNPHCYLIPVFEAILDHHLATGEAQYLDAAEGAWELMRAHWLHQGGSIALCEGQDYPPGSYFIDPAKHTGELCGSVFWMRFNQRFHRLRPDDERHVAEIERSIYNVLLPGQSRGAGFRYHTRLEGHLDRAQTRNTCCEGQGTRGIGSLPEYVWSLGDDGVWLNLYAASTLATTVGGRALRLRLDTAFPADGRVRLTVESTPGRFVLRLRIPAWASGPVTVHLDDGSTSIGQPGTYLTMDRAWAAGQTLTFTLPLATRLVRYRGADSIEWHQRFSLQHGPLLLAVSGPPMGAIPIHIAQHPDRFPAWLRPDPDRPLRWRLAGAPEYEVLPYHDLTADRHFSCFPVLTGEAGLIRI